MFPNQSHYPEVNYTKTDQVFYSELIKQQGDKYTALFKAYTSLLEQRLEEKKTVDHIPLFKAIQFLLNVPDTFIRQNKNILQRFIQAAIHHTSKFNIEGVKASIELANKLDTYIELPRYSDKTVAAEKENLQSLIKKPNVPKNENTTKIDIQNNPNPALEFKHLPNEDPTKICVEELLYWQQNTNYKKPALSAYTNVTLSELANDPETIINDSFIHFDWTIFPSHSNTVPELSYSQKDKVFYKKLLEKTGAEYARLFRKYTQELRDLKDEKGSVYGIRLGKALKFLANIRELEFATQHSTILKEFITECVPYTASFNTRSMKAILHLASHYKMKLDFPQNNNSQIQSLINEYNKTV